MTVWQPSWYPKPGSYWIKVGETMSWKSVCVDDTFDEVELSGPGPCRGIMRVELSEFANGKWKRC
jgi:hypothetical protein